MTTIASPTAAARDIARRVWDQHRRAIVWGGIIGACAAFWGAVFALAWAVL
jgi:hypothetical protein